MQNHRLRFIFAISQSQLFHSQFLLTFSLLPVFCLSFWVPYYNHQRFLAIYSFPIPRRSFSLALSLLPHLSLRFCSPFTFAFICWHLVVANSNSRFTIGIFHRQPSSPFTVANSRRSFSSRFLLAIFRHNFSSLFLVTISHRIFARLVLVTASARRFSFGLLVTIFRSNFCGNFSSPFIVITYFRILASPFVDDISCRHSLTTFFVSGSPACSSLPFCLWNFFMAFPFSLLLLGIAFVAASLLQIWFIAFLLCLLFVVSLSLPLCTIF